MIITSSIYKLIQHPSICSGNLHPITAQIDLTNACNMHCYFCNTDKISNRKSKSIEKKHINTDMLNDILSNLKSFGCKGIQYTGAGEPTLHPEFSTIIYNTAQNFSVGLVTNGSRLHKIPTDILKLFDWIRISINAGPNLYKQVHGTNLFNRIINNLSLLDKLNVFYGISYVFSEQPLNDFIELYSILQEKLNNIKYIRLASDIYKPQHLELIEDIKQLNSKIFIDCQINRDLSIPNKCIIYKIKPRIDIYGNVYPCCTSHMFKINKIGTYHEYFSILKNKQIYTINTQNCPYCIYRKINDFCVNIDNITEIKNPNFV